MAAGPSTEVSYVAQHEALVGALVPELRRVARAGIVEADLVYCSRSGPPQARWLEPDVNDHLEAQVAGHLTDGSPRGRPGGVVVAPFGFISDHMEVVFDLDTEAAQTARDLGMPYARAATVAPTRPSSTPWSTSSSSGPAAARGEDVPRQSTTGVGPFHTVCPSDCCLLPGAPRPCLVCWCQHSPRDRPHSSGAPARAAGQPATTQEDSMSTPHPHAVVPPEQNRTTRDILQECRTASVSTPRASQARHAGTEATPHSHAAHARVTDPRDATDVDFDEVINKQYHYTLYSVFRLARPLPASRPSASRSWGKRRLRRGPAA